MTVLQYEVDNQTATLTIDRPERRNALSAEVITLMLAALDSAENDADVRAIVIRGAGDKAFCAGADLSGGVGSGGTNDYAQMLKRILNCPKPTIARVNGYCLAGGMGVMLACDIVIASESAVFGTPEVNVGLWPMMISALIYRNMLPKQALPMILLGERFGADKALAMGFLTEVVAATALDETVAALAAKLVTKSPIGMKIGKESYNAMQEMPLNDALGYLNDKLGEVAVTDDAREGITAFMEKRPPNFTGN